jgi:hypothetical protein
MTNLAPDPRCFACALPDCDDDHPACPVGAEERSGANARQTKARRNQTPEAYARRRAYLTQYQRERRAAERAAKTANKGTGA